MKNFALLIDTVSIQQYIFSSNRLKENIGASYIVENELFNEVYFTNMNAEIGYIGGGNALLFFETSELRSDFKENYNAHVLSNYPGIRIAYGEVDNFDRSEDGFQKSRNAINSDLICQKFIYHLECVPYKMGIVDDCPSSNEGIEDTIDNKEVSKQTAIKRIKGDTSNNKLNQSLSPIISKYRFTNELSELGQPSEKSYIAIVHADGNGIGKQFMDCKSLKELQELSNEVKNIANDVMNDLVRYLIEITPTLEKDSRFKIKNQCLPFRQIVAGGDDITFVCEGKLGVHLAYKTLQIMNSTKNGTRKAVSACAGIAIVHTKFPFYKAYQLAEELCALAKKESREKENGNDNRLAFLVSTGNLAGDLDAIVENNYKHQTGNLFGGSYSLGTENSLTELIKGIRYFQSDKFPKNKAMQLRDMLKASTSSQEYFLAELRARGLKLPNPYEQTKLFEENRTTLYDMLNLIEFFPEFLNENKNDEVQATN